VYRYADKVKAPAMAALEAAEAEGKRRAEEQAQPLTVRGILASLGMKTEQVDRMMLASSLAVGGGGGGGGGNGAKSGAGAGAGAAGGKVSPVGFGS
jgi:hypothetical protein